MLDTKLLAAVFGTEELFSSGETNEACEFQITQRHHALAQYVSRRQRTERYNEY